MIADLRVGDYIEKSELDTEQKYNDVVEVFKSFGFSGYKTVNDYHSAMNDAFPLIFIKDDRFVLCGYAAEIQRKLTYNDMMSLKHLNEMKVERDKVEEENNKLISELVSKCEFESLSLTSKDGNKYHREIIGFCGTKVEVDVYRVLDAFKTGSAALDRAAKKILCAGIRGHKDYVTDIDNAIESLQEAKKLHMQKLEIDNQ